MTEQPVNFRDEPFFLVEDPFEADWSHAWEAEPEMPPFLELDELLRDPPPVPADDERWAWHDARLVGVYRGGETPGYEIGCVDLYGEPDGRDLTGWYVPLASFSEEAVAAAFYHDVQAQIDAAGLAPSQVPDFALEQAQALNRSAEWRPASRDEIDAYELQRDLELTPALDVPAPELEERLREEAAELGRAGRMPSPTLDEPAAFHALEEIGIDAEALDLSADPPPFYDAESGTAYWIGIFQPNRDDREHCVTSILSLTPTASGYEAQLAPCVPGDWDKAHEAAEFLLAQAQKGGIERAFDAAEGMALATDQRALWEKERGLVLDDGVTQDLADYAEQWEMWNVHLTF